MLNARVDNSGLNRRAAAWRANVPAAERLIVEALGSQFVAIVIRRAPTDTFRYQRGWSIAANQAGLGPYTVRSVRRSRYADVLVVRLEKQIDVLHRNIAKKEESVRFWTTVYANRYERTGRRGKWERDCRAKKDRAIKRLAKMDELLKFASDQLSRFKNGDAGELVIWGRSKAKDTAKSRYASVRDKVYGGSGSWKMVAGKTYLELRNLEPHATIVEANTGLVRDALRSVRGMGLRKYTPAMVKILGATN